LRIFSLCLFGLLSGCGAKGSGDSGTGSFSDTGTPDTPDTGSDEPDTLPDLLSEATDPEGCEEVLGEEIAGAASMFFGEYTQSDGVWVGEERWLLYANQAWRDIGGSDCEVVWVAQALEIDAPVCAGCNFGLSTTLVINETATTCDLGIVGAGDGTTTYGIARQDDGAATWFFGGSGDLLGDGHHISDAMNFLSEPSCRWW